MTRAVTEAGCQRRTGCKGESSQRVAAKRHKVPYPWETALRIDSIVFCSSAWSVPSALPTRSTSSTKAPLSIERLTAAA